MLFISYLHNTHFRVFLNMKSPNSQIQRPPIKMDLIDIDTICSDLLPKDGGAFDYKDFCARRLDKIRKIGKINLAATGKDLVDDDKQGGDVSMNLFAAVDMEAEAVSERLPELESNHLFGLLMGFLAVEDWHHARVLLARLDNAVEHVQICSALFRLIHNSTETANSKELVEMLVCVGPYMYRDTLLLKKVCRAVKEDARLEVIKEVLGACLLPSLHLVPANPAVGHEIWELLKLLPYEDRYQLYGEWEKEDEELPMILAAKQIAKLDTRRVLKRIAKENAVILGETVANLAHSNPLTVLRLIVQQIEAYKDMIPLVVDDALKNLTELEFDILEYVVIERLALPGRNKLKDDGINASDWLQSLASFWGYLCDKYPSKVYMRGLFQYLINQLKRGNGIELVFLQQLIEQMAMIGYIENLSEDQLDFMATDRKDKKKTKSAKRLRDVLLEHKLAVPLLILLAQHRSAVVINSDAPHVKMVSEEFDRCNGILRQYVKFLSSSVTPTSSYALLIPSLDELINHYHLEPEVAFHIYRPVMRLFCPLTSSTLLLDLGSSHKPISWSDLLGTVRTTLPESPDLYAAFWGLTLHDLYVPKNLYKSERTKQRAALRELKEADSISAILESLDRLRAEQQKHEDHVASVHTHLAGEKDKWLKMMNMEFLQHCIFPRCTFSMPDAVYCAMFVNTLGVVNHMDALICKTLHPMICCSTEYEAGRLGKFLYKTADYSKSWTWSEGITRILIQCLESREYMEIRNALVLLTKISSVFPVTRKSGISLEEQVAKIKEDEREDLKVLAAGVSAALAARKASLIRDEVKKEPSVDRRLLSQRQDDSKRRREDDQKWEEGHTKRRKLNNIPLSQPYGRRPAINTSHGEYYHVSQPYERRPAINTCHREYYPPSQRYDQRLAINTCYRGYGRDWNDDYGY